VVDDEKTLRYALQEGLSEEGYRVETAGDVAGPGPSGPREYHLALLDQKLRMERAGSPERDPLASSGDAGRHDDRVRKSRTPSRRRKPAASTTSEKPFELDHMKLVIRTRSSQTRCPRR